jgi:hypothetical protein
MKKVFFILLMLSFRFAYAGTGSGRDEVLLILSIIAVMSFILALLYSIDFVKRRIKEHREKKAARAAGEAVNESLS